MRAHRIILRVGLAAALSRAAYAGPPFITDDPEPTEPGHWEIYDFAQGAQARGGFAGAGGLDINYGGFRDVQLTAVVPANFETGSRGRAGLGDIELATKYRILR